MSGARRPAVAGTFYPSDPHELGSTVDGLLDHVSVSVDEPIPVAVVVPHAGYRYSGPVAGSGYARLSRLPHVDRVVILGPAHFVAVPGLALPTATSLETPLGAVPVDRAGCARLVEKGLADNSDAAHDREHSVEVQLPFLQRVLTESWSCVPVVVGRCGPDLLPDALDLLDRHVVVISTDLSHYLHHAAAQRRDRRTAAAVVERRPDRIRSDDACGVYPLRGFLTWTLRHEHRVRLLDLRTSADTAGSRARVVGYGAFAATAQG
jgi:hypothetical protein